jgi:hypothetical protein
VCPPSRGDNSRGRNYGEGGAQRRWLKAVQLGPVLDDPINGESFRTDVDQVLVPTLKGTVFNNINAL